LLRTLDVRTLAVAGGSLARLQNGRIAAVGPRSAHIAGYAYAAFSDVATIAGARADIGDGVVALLALDGARIAITPTCAANALGIVPEGAFARGNADAAREGCARAAAALGMDGDALARAILDAASLRLGAVVKELLADYRLDRATTVLVGGGGGAAALVPYAAQQLGLEYRIARDAEVISPLGVALALVRDVVERTIVDPTAGDLARIRREAIDAAVAAGATAERVDVVVEVDTARNRVRATASGATALVERDAVTAAVDDADRINAAAEHLRAAPDAVRIVAQTATLAVIASERAAAVVDERGVVRLVLPSARVRAIRRGQLAAVLARAIDEDTTYGDVGRALPDLFVLRRSRIAEFTGMADADQLAALAEEELAGVDDEEPVVVLTVPRRA